MGKTFPKLIIYKHFRACIVLYLACTVDTNNLFIIHLFTGFQELEMLVHIFCVPNSMFTYRIIHLTFHAPQIVVCTCMQTNMYLAVHLLQRQKYFRVEGKPQVCSTHHQSSTQSLYLDCFLLRKKQQMGLLTIQNQTNRQLSVNSV